MSQQQNIFQAHVREFLVQFLWLFPDVKWNCHGLLQHRENFKSRLKIVFSALKVLTALCGYCNSCSRGRALLCARTGVTCEVACTAVQTGELDCSECVSVSLSLCECVCVSALSVEEHRQTSETNRNQIWCDQMMQWKVLCRRTS